jgi:methylmalonyl-CoA mutase N-terminal domain/subunit
MMKSEPIRIRKEEGRGKTKDIEERVAAWSREVLAPALQAHPPRRTAFHNDSGVPLEPVYTPADLDERGFDYLEHLGLPGEYPFTRGISPEMYRSQFWRMTQYAGYGAADEANARYRYLLDQGATGVTIALDLPTQIGLDSDDPLAAGEVGKVGVAIDSLADMEALFAGIPLDRVQRLYTTANSIGPIMLAFYLEVAEKQGVSPRSFQGAIQNDVLKEYAARGTYIFPPEHGVKLVGDVIEYCAQHLPGWVPINVAGTHFKEAGGTPVQELAFTLADAIAYIEHVRSRGLRVDQFVKGWEFILGPHMNLFEEVAKLRAVRRLWARLLRERFGAQDDDSCKLGIYCGCAPSDLTAQQPLNNIVRVAFKILSSVLGGCQVQLAASYDEALGIPTEEAAQVALRTQQIIAHETGVADVVDPLGGSYYIESLTDEIERQVRGYLDRIEAMGGALGAIASGYFQRELAEGAYRHQREVETGERVVVGVNRFRSDEETPVPIFRSNPEGERRQIARLRELRARRDQREAAAALEELRRATEANANSVPALRRCVRAYCTIGEMCAELRAIYGEYRQPQAIV